MGPPIGGGGGGNKPPPSFFPNQNVDNNRQYPPQNQQQTFQQNEQYNSQPPYTSTPIADQAANHQYQPQPEQRSVRMRPQPDNTRPQYPGYGPMVSGSSIQQPQVVPPPGQEQQDFDEEDGRPGYGPRVNVNVHYQEAQQQQIGNATPDIFTSFLVNRMENDGYDVPQQLRRRQGGNNEREIAKVLQRIGDDMSNHSQLNNLISGIRVTPDTVYKTFFSVASEIFSDGNINWGRICTLFYFAYKLAIQVLNEMPLVDIVIDWVKRYVFDKLVGWILARGGWKAVHEYFGATPKQLVFVFLAGVAISSMFWYWKK